MPWGRTPPVRPSSPGRSSAGGVGPLPFKPRRRWPPEPTTAPFFEPGLRRAPGLGELPAIEAPPRAGRGVLDRDAGRGKLVADGIGRRVVLARAGRLPLLQRDGHQPVDRVAQAGAA